MDYRKLLKKYVEHVGECEGTAFLRDQYRTRGITDEEWAELQRLGDEELDDDGPPATRGGVNPFRPAPDVVNLAATVAELLDRMRKVEERLQSTLDVNHLRDGS